jgi:CRISPR-associated protein Cmr1
MARAELPKPPAVDGLSGLKRTARSRRQPLERMTVDLITTTPIFGGGAEPGRPDELMPIRAASIRGHLRFWWRALCPPDMPPDEMRAEEQKLFGGAAGEDGAASNVIVHVSDVRPTGLDSSNPSFNSADGYALFPARGERGQPAKGRWKPGLTFTLTIDAPGARAAAVRQAVLAWILFGGYGGRTRRGLGSLACASDASRSQWLPATATAAAIELLLARDIFANPDGIPAGDTPRLAGATLLSGPAGPSGVSAWNAAVGYLRMFRQGENLARDQGQAGRPGRSRWPEADKVRRLVGRDTAHQPRHNATPAWPRAVFGLPIVARFQQKDRNHQPYPVSEPTSFEVLWRDATGSRRDRLASPLILKPLALSNGTFTPIALWLDRGFPQGEVIATITESRGRSPVREDATAAPFDQMLAEGDTPHFQPLVGHACVRDAFLAWILTQRQWSHVAGAAPR